MSLAFDQFLLLVGSKLVYRMGTWNCGDHTELSNLGRFLYIENYVTIVVFFYGFAAVGHSHCIQGDNVTLIMRVSFFTTFIAAY